MTTIISPALIFPALGIGANLGEGTDANGAYFKTTGQANYYPPSDIRPYNGCALIVRPPPGFVITSFYATPRSADGSGYYALYDVATSTPGAVHHELGIADLTNIVATPEIVGGSAIYIYNASAVINVNYAVYTDTTPPTCVITMPTSILI